MNKSNFLLATVILLALSNPALSHAKRTKIRGPFGSWTWGPNIPHTHIPEASSDDGYSLPACSYSTKGYKKYDYRIENYTGRLISFSLDGKNKRLNDGWNTTFHKRVGSSCESRTLPPIVKFFDGHRKKAIRLPERDVGFQFLRVGNRITLTRSSSIEASTEPF